MWSGRNPFLSERPLSPVQPQTFPPAERKQQAVPLLSPASARPRPPAQAGQLEETASQAVPETHTLNSALNTTVQPSDGQAHSLVTPVWERGEERGASPRQGRARPSLGRGSSQGEGQEEAEVRRAALTCEPVLDVSSCSVMSSCRFQPRSV